MEEKDVFAVLEELRHLEHENFSLLALDLELEVLFFVLTDRRFTVELSPADLVVELADLQHLGLRDELHKAEASAVVDLEANYFY